MIYEKMKAATEAVGVYSPNAVNLGHELRVYAEELDLLYEDLDEMFREGIESVSVSLEVLSQEPAVHLRDFKHVDLCRYVVRDRRQSFGNGRKIYHVGRGVRLDLLARFNAKRL